MTRFMLEGSLTESCHRELVQQPRDLDVALATVVQQAGGQFEAAYFGIHNGRIYLIVELPNEKSLSRLLMAMRTAGQFESITATEVVTGLHLECIAKGAAGVQCDLGFGSGQSDG